MPCGFLNIVLELPFRDLHPRTVMEWGLRFRARFVEEVDLSKTRSARSTTMVCATFVARRQLTHYWLSFRKNWLGIIGSSTTTSFAREPWNYLDDHTYTLNSTWFTQKLLRSKPKQSKGHATSCHRRLDRTKIKVHLDKSLNELNELTSGSARSSWTPRSRINSFIVSIFIEILADF